jgi:Tfp pilus assembly protein PilF
MVGDQQDFNLAIRCGTTYWRPYYIGLAAVFVLLLLSYSNSFNCSWHFDDYDNINNNTSIQIKEITWDSIKRISAGIMGIGLLSRPVSYLSFALNYYFGGLNVFGYHVVNFAIHYLSFVFLFLFIFNSLKLPILKERYGKHSYTIALLSALLWVINPVQVLAVTYIVQRMASMAALFYIMSMYLYLQFRTADNHLRSGIYLAACLLFGIIAIGSKENAVMLPFSILLYDLFFIQGLTKENIKRNIKIVGIPLLIMVLATFLFYDFSADLNDYKTRPFTMGERLLTEPRIILFYISLLFYPLTSRLTMIHDFGISKSLIDPWSTSVAILIIIIILVVSLVNAKKWPLISFCIIFFFLNHLIEGSFFSLELIYEHRNYLPSMLLFVPLSVGFVRCLEFYSHKKGIFCLFSGAMVLILIVLSVAVYVRNDIMKDDMSLWRDNVAKAPRLHNPRQWLAVSLLNSGHLTEARMELERALDSYESGRTTKKSLTYGCLGEYYWVLGEDDNALEYLRKSVNLHPPDTYIPLSFDRMARIYTKKGLLDKAEEVSRKAISMEPEQAAFYFTYGEVLIKKGKPDEAIKVLQKAIILKPDWKLSYALIADAFALKKNRSAEYHFRKLSK